ncbi:MAG: hypothetical protein V5A33_06540 [Halobacteriales archaeon]
MTIDRRPSRVNAVCALLAAFAAAALVGIGARVALLGAATGVVALTAGLVARSRSWLTVGALGLLAGVLAGGLLGVDDVRVVVGAALTLVAWDLAENAVGLGAQVGRRASTTRVEVVRVGVSAVVGTAAAGLAPFGSLPLSSLVVGLAAGVVLFAALRL